MPIRVQCPGCRGKFAAPDAAAGRTLACPKCKGGVAVPKPEPEPEVVAVEVVEDAPEPAEPAEEAPRRKKKKPVPVGPPPVAKVAAGVMALLFVGGIVGAMARGKPHLARLEGSTETEAFVHPDGHFSADFPGGEPTRYADEAAGTDDWTSSRGGADYTVRYLATAPKAGKLSETNSRLTSVLAAGGTLLHERDVTSPGGVAGREAAARGSRTVVVREYRVGPGGKSLVVAVVSGRKSLDPDDEAVRDFLESVEPAP